MKERVELSGAGGLIIIIMIIIKPPERSNHLRFAITAVLFLFNLTYICSSGI